MRGEKWSRGVARGERGNQFGWRVHEALQGWTASVDAKASIGLLVEVAVAGAAVRSLLTVNDELSQAGGVHLVSSCGSWRKGAMSTRARSASGPRRATTARRGR